MQALRLVTKSQGLSDHLERIPSRRRLAFSKLLVPCNVFPDAAADHFFVATAAQRASHAPRRGPGILPMAHVSTRTVLPSQVRGATPSG